MDKYEYKVRSEEIKSLIKKKEFQQAAELADTIDWTRVRSVTMLCTISDLYKVNRRYEEARILLEQAYDKYPGGRMIVYSLCELCIKMGDTVAAVEYYKQFVQMAPTDNGKFILQYKIYEAENVNIEERIAVLEELKKREYKEKWGYELAYLYHRIGLGTKCVEECDELIVWFREGPYVKKAMELKMLHQQLTDSQMSLYESMVPPSERPVVEQPKAEVSSKEDDIMVKTMDMGKYNTINLQRALAESMKDVLVADNNFQPLVDSETGEFKSELQTELELQETQELDKKQIEQELENQAPQSETSEITGMIIAPMMVQDTGEMEELFFDDRTKANEGMREAIQELTKEEPEEAPAPAENIPGTIDDAEKPMFTAQETQTYDPVKELELTMMYDPSMLPEELKPEEPVTTEEPAESEEIPQEEIVAEEKTSEATKVFSKEDLEVIHSATEKVADDFPSEDIGNKNKEELMQLIDQKVQEALAIALGSGKIVVNQEEQPKTPDIKIENGVPVHMENMLSQEYDGQIKLVVPEAEPVEKQITGQMNIQDILDEWENTKYRTQEKHEAKLLKQVSEQTGELFTEYEEIIKNSEIKLEEPVEEISEAENAEKEYNEYINNLTKEDEAAEEESVGETEIEVEAEATEEPVEEETDTTEEEATESEEETDEVEEIEEISEGDEEDEEEKELSEEEKISALEQILDEGNTAELTMKKAESKADEEEDEEDDESESESDNEEEDSSDIDKNRTMTEEEISLFGQFAQTKRARQKLLGALDKVSLAAYTGNVYVTGDMTEEAIELAKNVVRYIQSTDSNFSGKIGRVTGESLNNKSMAVMVEKLANGGLIIEKASGMSAETTKDLLKELNQEKTGIVVVLQDTKKRMRKMMDHFNGMKQIFNVHVEVEELSDDALVAYGKKYAEHMEYSIDDMGVLALHTRIDELQTADHVVTVADVRDIVDEAIANANKKSFKHFTDVLLAKRYDEEDMIILREKDFIN